MNKVEVNQVEMDKQKPLKAGASHTRSPLVIRDLAKTGVPIDWRAFSLHSPHSDFVSS